MISSIIRLVVGKRVMVMVMAGAILAAFSVGFFLGWDIKGSLQLSANMKAIKKDIEVKNELDEIRNNKPDELQLLNILRLGKY